MPGPMLEFQGPSGLQSHALAPALSLALLPLPRLTNSELPACRRPADKGGGGESSQGHI